MKQENFKLPNKFLYVTGVLALLLGLPAVSFLRSVSVRNTETQVLGSGRKVASVGPIAQSNLAHESLASAPSIFEESDVNAQIEADLEKQENISNASANLSSKSHKSNVIHWDVACPSGGRGPSNDEKLNKDTINKGKLDSAFLQLSGKSCLPREVNGSSAEFSVTNTTNGFTATVFSKNSSGNEYQTDLIQLNEGENLIQISYVTGDGNKKSLNFSVQSEPAKPTVR